MKRTIILKFGYYGTCLGHEFFWPVLRMEVTCDILSTDLPNNAEYEILLDGAQPEKDMIVPILLTNDTINIRITEINEERTHCTAVLAV